MLQSMPDVLVAIAILVFISAFLGILSLAGWLETQDRNKAAAAHAVFLKTGSADALAAEVCTRVTSWGWDRFVAARPILSRTSPWTDKELFDAIELLWAEAAEEDRRKRTSPRDSNNFSFSDSGLSLVQEALSERLKTTRP